MQKNDIFSIEITDMGVNGEGIGHYDGMTFFIKDALIGDVILARATRIKKNYGYARVEEMISPSTFRIEPECKLHRSCGGCQIQAMDYQKQLEFKLLKVRGNLIRIGGFSEEEIDRIMEPLVGMEYPYRYRNKAQFPVGRDKGGNIITGFYAARTHNIMDIDDCLLGVEENQHILAIIKEWMQSYQIAPYEEKTQTGLVRHVLIRYGFSTGEIMVCLIINGRKLPYGKELAAALQEAAGMTSISYNINMEKTNVILGKETICIWGQSYITDHLHLRDSGTEPDNKNKSLHGSGPADTVIAYHISPQSFYQVNPIQTEKLYRTALEYAGLTGQESVWDLYCGIGTISLFLSRKAKQVYGVEVIPQAIEDAKDNAKLNNITNVEFLLGNVEEVLPEFYERMNRQREKNRNKDQSGQINTSDMLRPDVIVVDPPRKGCDEKCLETMLRMSPKRIVYVSCDPATLARDLRILCEGGYEVRRMRVFDQFCHTVHVETVVMLSHKKPDSVILSEVIRQLPKTESGQ